MRTTLASVTSPLAEKCSLSCASSTCLGRFLMIIRDVCSGCRAGGAEPPAAAPSLWPASMEGIYGPGGSTALIFGGFIE